MNDQMLRAIVGQAGMNLHPKTEDPFRLSIAQLQYRLAKMDPTEVRAGLDTLTSVFQMNSKGQLVMQINREVVSIGIIEFRLNMNGLSEMADSMMEQIKF